MLSSGNIDFLMITLQGTNISHQKSLLKMIFLFPRWDMLIPWRVYTLHVIGLFNHWITIPTLFCTKVDGLEALNASDGQILWNFEPDVPVWNFLALFPDKDAWCLFKMAVAGLSRIFCYNMVLCFF